MKISVITLHTVNNYGSALQTYATQTVLEQLGHAPEFVDYWRKDNFGKSAVDKALQSAPMQRYRKYWDLNVFTRFLVRIPLRFVLIRKRAPMRRFVAKRVHLTPHAYYSLEDLLTDTPQADLYMTGSDQVWNSVWNQGIEQPFFLTYAPEGKKRIAFSASIGRTMLNADEIEPTTALLKKYDWISMREKSGVDLLHTMGIESQLILDPTLMLNPQQWLAIERPFLHPKPYLLIYQLNTNTKMNQYAVELGKRKEWDIIRISYGYSAKQEAGKCLICPSVELFLGCFSHAACVLTDSFHATAFALNFSVRCISILPERFGTRIESILALMGTSQCLLTDYSDFSVADCEIDFADVQNRLETYRNQGLNTLKEVLQ